MAIRAVMVPYYRRLAALLLLLAAARAPAAATAAAVSAHCREWAASSKDIKSDSFQGGSLYVPKRAKPCASFKGEAACVGAIPLVRGAPETRPNTSARPGPVFGSPDGQSCLWEEAPAPGGGRAWSWTTRGIFAGKGAWPVDIFSGGWGSRGSTTGLFQFAVAAGECVFSVTVKAPRWSVGASLRMHTGNFPPLSSKGDPGREFLTSAPLPYEYFQASGDSFQTAISSPVAGCDVLPRASPSAAGADACTATIVVPPGLAEAAGTVWVSASVLMSRADPAMAFVTGGKPPADAPRLQDEKVATQQLELEFEFTTALCASPAAAKPATVIAERKLFGPARDYSPYAGPYQATKSRVYKLQRLTRVAYAVAVEPAGGGGPPEAVRTLLMEEAVYAKWAAACGCEKGAAPGECYDRGECAAPPASAALASTRLCDAAACKGAAALDPQKRYWLMVSRPVVGPKPITAGEAPASQVPFAQSFVSVSATGAWDEPVKVYKP